MKKNIKFVRWDITPHCNLNCQHCYATEMYRKDKRELSLAELEVCIDRICNVAENVIFYGGEPLMRKDLPEIVSLCGERDMNTHVITNGTLITRESAEKLANAGLKQMGISVDAATENTYAAIRGRDYFLKIIDTIKMIADYPFMMSMGFVISTQNYEEVGAFIELADDLNVDQIIFIPLAPVGNAKDSEGLNLTPHQYVETAQKIAEKKSSLGLKDDFVVLDFAPPLLVDYMNRTYGSKLLEEPKWCFAGTGSLFIRADGRVYPCKGYVEEYGDGNGRAGTYSLLEKTLPEILGGEYFDEIFQLSAPALLEGELPECKKCKYFLTYCKPCPRAASNPEKDTAELCLGFKVGEICEEVKKAEEVYHD